MLGHSYGFGISVAGNCFMINPLVTNGLSHPYHLDESTFIFRGIWSDFSFLFHFPTKFMLANRIAQDETALHLGLFCVPMSHKKDARLIYGLK